MKCRAKACLAVAFALVLIATAAHADLPIYTKLVVPLLFDDSIPVDVALVGEAVNEITRRKIGAEVELVPLLYNATVTNPDPRKLAELMLLEKQGKRFDVLPDTFPDASFIPLDDLLLEYGQDILAIVGGKRMAYSRENGALYKLPSVSDYVSSAGLTMRKDIVEKYGIDLSRIHTFADLDALFAFVKEREPDMYMVCGYRTGGSFIYRFKHTDIIAGGVIGRSGADPSRLVNYYATDAYRQTVMLIRKWHAQGYIPANLALQNLTSSQFVRAGELFSYFSAYKPGIEYEGSVNCGMEMVTVPLMEPVVTRSSLSLQHWGIAQTCINPGKAMQFLNLLYSDGDLANLLIYGIENVHYAVQPNGTIDYPEGIDRDTVGYLNNQPWLIPNQLITHVWHGNDPLLWEKTRIFNESAPFHDALDFSFDDASVLEENQKLNAIASRYGYGLETGQLDPEIYLPLMLKEMEDAGAGRVLAEAQAQFDAWLNGKDPA